MADLGTNLKNFWMKSMEAIGNTATNIANNTRYKVDEMNTVNRRAEILADFGNKAYALWQKGEVFPASLEEQLQELKRLDEKLNDLRAERLAGVKTDSAAACENESDADKADKEAAHPLNASGMVAPTLDMPEDGAEKAETMPADEKDDVPVIQVETVKNEESDQANASVPLSDTISQLFEQVPSAQEVSDRVNGALDSLGKSLKDFSDGIDQSLDDLSDQVTGNEASAEKNEKDPSQKG